MLSLDRFLKWHGVAESGSPFLFQSSDKWSSATIKGKVMASCNHLGAKKQRAKFVCALREIFLVLIIFARDYSLNGHRLNLPNRSLTAGGTAASPMESQSHQRKNEKKERTLIFFWATGLCKLSTVIFGTTQLNGSRCLWIVWAYNYDGQAILWARWIPTCPWNCCGATRRSKKSAKHV